VRNKSQGDSLSGCNLHNEADYRFERSLVRSQKSEGDFSFWYDICMRGGFRSELPDCSPKKDRYAEMTLTERKGSNEV